MALGAAGIAGLAITMFPVTAGQAVAGVATGIGFLGVGIIWRAEGGQTLGLTTAASILCVAAIGVITGIGLYLTAVLGTALALFILEFDRMPGLRGLHGRVTGRPDEHDETRLAAASSRARSKTSSSIASVSLPVNVFCWLGWKQPSRVKGPTLDSTR